MHHGLLLKYFFCDLTESPSGLGFGTLKALEIVYEQKKFFENKIWDTMQHINWYLQFV